MNATRSIAAMLAAGALATTGCSPASEQEQRAVAAFERFQDAVFAGDRGALRAVVSADSRPAVAALPLERTRGKQRLRVVGTTRRDPEVLVKIEDPNEGVARRTWVVVREDGRMCVDLLASTAYNHETRAGPATEPHLELRELDRAELDRIHSRRR